MEVIVPAAGLSSRFPNMKPKYLLYDYKGDLMLKNSIKQYLNCKNTKITVGILKEHNEKYNAELFITKELPEVNIVIIDEVTSGPADTIYKIINKAKIKNTEILIKDCDSFFNHANLPGNYICISDIKSHEILKKISSKSFVELNNQSIIINIVEKEVISNNFCVGAYKFEDTSIFVNAFKKIVNTNTELFVSHVIQQCLSENTIFSGVPVENYIDVGTAKDWFDYNDKPVIFCDIDGTIIHAQARYGDNSYESIPIILEKNVECLLNFQKNGSQIIFTTARPYTEIDITEKMLNSLGFKDYKLIIGINNSRRILINDYNDANPFPRAESINLKRNSDNLSDYLK